jgi:hypothetical protein
MDPNQNWFQLVVAKAEPTWTDEKKRVNQTDLEPSQKKKSQQTIGP